MVQIRLRFVEIFRLNWPRAFASAILKTVHVTICGLNYKGL
jgi:hypothetical protein